MFDKWKRKLKEKLNRINEDDRGSAFLVVILGVMAVTMIGATIMSLATNYVITVIVDQKSTDNFYETESGLAEIRSGIEEICGECNENAYMDIIKNYNSDALSGTMRAKYANEYLTGVISKLTGTVVTWDGVDQPNPDDWHSFSLVPIQKMTTRPTTVSSTYGGNVLRYGFRKEGSSDEMYLVIRGLQIEYKDEDGYQNKIQTDIKIGVPDYSFEGNSTFDEMKKYIVICDDKLSVSTTSGGSGGTSVDVTGNVYTGGKTGKHGEDDNYETGIEILPQAKTVRFNSDRIISRGDLQINNGAEVELKKQDGELWLKNIILPKAPDSGSTLQTKLDMFTNAYILDDMSINNNNAYVHIAGKYYGYSYNEDNNASRTDDNNSEYSSAILINGANTTLESNNLVKLILAGRTFVSKNDKNYVQLASSDIMMGESLAVKSNQIAYLVPTECIIAGHNPLINSEIDADDIMASINLDALKQTVAWEFLNQAKPVIPNFNNSGGYVFLYLNFKDQNNANKYFSKFYSDAENKESLDNRAESYISTTDMYGMKLDAGLYLIAGNIIHNYYATNGSVKQTANYFDGSGNPNGEMLSDGLKKMRNYLGMQLSLLNSGYKSGMNPRYELLGSSQQEELVQDKIVYFDRITTNVTRENVDTDVGGRIFITPGNCNVSSSIQQGLIVAGGDVTVDQNFEGLILAKGVVTVHGSTIKATANLSMVGSLLDMIKNDSSLSKYFRGLEDKDDHSINVSDCIFYENWKRNED